MKKLYIIHHEGKNGTDIHLTYGMKDLRKFLRGINRSFDHFQETQIRLEKSFLKRNLLDYLESSGVFGVETGVEDSKFITVTIDTDDIVNKIFKNLTIGGDRC